MKQVKIIAAQIQLSVVTIDSETGDIEPISV